MERNEGSIVGLEAGKLMIQAPKLVRSFILVYILKIISWPPKFLSFSRWPPSLKKMASFSCLWHIKEMLLNVKCFND